MSNKPLPPKPLDIPDRQRRQSIGGSLSFNLGSSLGTQSNSQNCNTFSGSPISNALNSQSPTAGSPQSTFGRRLSMSLRTSGTFNLGSPTQGNAPFLPAAQRGSNGNGEDSTITHSPEHINNGESNNRNSSHHFKSVLRRTSLRRPVSEIVNRNFEHLAHTAPARPESPMGKMILGGQFLD